MTVVITIRAVRGTTEYNFRTEHPEDARDSYTHAEQEAALFERWLNDQPVRFAENDRRSAQEGH